MCFKVLLCEITWRNCSISKRAKMLMLQVKDLNAGLRAQLHSLSRPPGHRASRAAQARVRHSRQDRQTTPALVGGSVWFCFFSLYFL